MTAEGQGPSPGSAHSLISPERRFLIFLLLVFAVALALYRPAFRFQFLEYDDPQYVSENVHVQRGLNAESVRWAFTSFSVENWHPLTWLSYMADYQMFGKNPAGPHIINVLLHCLNAALLFWLLFAATGSLYRSLLVALIFAVHPLGVQSVAWVSERKNLLSTLFGLLALAAYGRYARDKSVKAYILALLLFACSLMAKPYLVTLPFLLLLLDFWPLGRWNPRHLLATGEVAEGSIGLRRLLAEKVPFLLLAIASSVLTLLAQGRGGAIRTMRAVPLSTRLANSVIAYMVYTRQTLWPGKLSVFYPLRSAGAAPVALSVLMLAAITLLAWKFGSRRYLLVGWLWFLGTLLPMIGLVQVGNQAHADRYMYIPIMGLIVAIIWGAADVVETRAMVPHFAFVAGLLAVGLLSWQTHHELPYWQDTMSLFSRAIAVVPANSDVEDELGEVLINAGQVDEAIAHFNRALKQNPQDGIAHYNLGRVLEERGDFSAAIRHFDAAVALAGREDDSMVAAGAHNNLGVMYLQLGRQDLAETNLDQAIAFNPKEYKSFAARGMMRYQQHRLLEAEADFKSSIAITPSAFSWFELGVTLQDEHKPLEALSAFEQALSITPDLPEAKERIATLKHEMQASQSDERTSGPK